MSFETNFDFKTIIGRNVKILLTDYTEIKGLLSLFGLKDRTVVIEDYTHIFNGEIIGKGRNIIIKENFWFSVAVEPENEREYKGDAQAEKDKIE